MEQTEKPRTTARIRNRLGARILAGGLTLGLAFSGIGTAEAQTRSTTTDPAKAGAWSEGSHRRGHGPGRPPRRAAKVFLATAAKAIGISEADLLKELRAGKSIAQVAESKNVEAKKVIEALVAVAKTRLSARVAAGDLTQARADKKLATLSERITKHVNRTGLGRRGEGPRPHGRGGPASQPRSAAPDA